MFLKTVPEDPSSRWIPKDRYKLKKPFKFVFTDFVITVPEGFIFSASIPGVLRSIIDPSELPPASYLLHDFLYSCTGNVAPGITFTRSESDKLFLQIMKIRGVNKRRRWFVYTSVRVGGLLAWLKHK